MSTILGMNITDEQLHLILTAAVALVALLDHWLTGTGRIKPNSLVSLLAAVLRAVGLSRVPGVGQVVSAAADRGVRLSSAAADAHRVPTSGPEETSNVPPENPDGGPGGPGKSALLLLVFLLPVLPACAGTQVQRFERAVLGAAKTVTAARRGLVVYGKAYTEAVVRDFKGRDPTEGRKKLDEWHVLSSQAASGIDAADAAVEEGYVVAQALEAGVATQPQREAWVRLAAASLGKLRELMDGVRRVVYPDAPRRGGDVAGESVPGGTR